MYQFEYADILSDSGANARKLEHEAIGKSIEMLRQAAAYPGERLHGHVRRKREGRRRGRS